MPENFAGEPQTSPTSSRGSFPAPPLPSGEGIEPIITPAQQVTEGREQHNCVASYAGRIASGSYYVYRVTRPERATLGLRRDRQDRWHIDQLAGPRKRKVSMELRAHIRGWFHASFRHRLAAPGEMPPPRQRTRDPHPGDLATPMLPGM